MYESNSKTNEKQENKIILLASMANTEITIKENNKYKKMIEISN